MKELTESVSLNDIEKTKAVLGKANIELSDESFYKLLCIAVINNYTEHLSILLKWRKKTDFIYSHELSPLIIGAVNGKTEAMEVLLENGAIVNHQETGRGNTALHLVVVGSKVNTIDNLELLMKFGASPDIKNNYDKTAIELAMQIGNKEYLDILNNSV